ncbi:MAG: hypothetical protein KDN19_20945 [Verrucomicrobiae bacterium]|nr:hypothetical protein [Verrucomicrobiae bacterium]
MFPRILGLCLGAAPLFVFTACEESSAPPVVFSPEPTVEGLVETVLTSDSNFRDVPFAKLIEVSTEHKVVPVDPASPVDAEILTGIRRAMAQTMEHMNRPESITNQERRINECSAHFEDAILHFVNAQPGLKCELPRNAEGNLQRAGYPDLMITHEASGRVAYLDPKLVETGSLDSSLRTFYFTPKAETGKILHDGHHLLVGIEHDGNTGKWQFLRWHLVDLSGFKVRLKAEFQADNRDIYRPELILESAEAP